MKPWGTGAASVLRAIGRAGPAVLWATQVGAQSSPALLQLADRGPRFYDASGSRPVATDAHTFAALRHTIALNLENATLPFALDAVSHASRLSLFYRDADLPTDKRVTLVASKITVAAALISILDDANLDVRVSSLGTLTLERRGISSDTGRLATIHGRVLNSNTHAVLAEVRVRLLPTDRQAVTGSDGRFAFDGVPRGTYTANARRLGYSAGERKITVDTAGQYVLDFLLAESPAVLDRVVTTMTGDQSIRQMGNVVGTIAADSVVNVAPVSSLSDVVETRVAGVQVFDGNILVGTSPAINIRGQNSFSLVNQPLLYIDGVRVSNDESTSDANTFAVGPGRFNDIIPEEISSIEIVKGPAASALYGTDAANGVILIKTKQGTSGAPKWNFFGEGGLLTVDKSRFSQTYYPWGTSTPGGQVTQCTLLVIAAAACAQDSVTQFNPLKVASLTPLGTGDLGNYGVQVSGGNPATRYFLSGTYSSETGYLKLDSWDKTYLERALSEPSLSSAILRPNAETKYGGRLNLTDDLTPSADVSVGASYIQQESRAPNGLNTLLNAETDAGYYNPSDPYFGGSPGTTFINENNFSTSHFVMNATPTWRMFNWLTWQGTVGVDHSQMDNTSYTPPNLYPGLVSYVADRKTTTTNFTLDGTITAARDVGILGTRTSVGGQYFRSDALLTGATGSDLSQGSQSLAGAGSYAVSDATSISIVYGVFFEEQFSLRQSLFITGGVRGDGSTSFGQGISAELYPRGNVSWSVANEPFWPHQEWISGLRLRAAYGEAGVQPPPTARVSQEGYLFGAVDGQTTQGIILQAVGNSRIAPERQAEFETGLDIDAVARRVHLELTYYDKHSSNAIIDDQAPNSVGAYNLVENVGSVRNWGYEGLASATVLDTRPVRWEFTFNGSINHNQLVRLADGISNTYGIFGSTSLVQGYPIWSYFANPITLHGQTSGGILTPSAVTVGTNPAYKGPSYPGIQASVGTTLSLFANALQLRVQFDHRGNVLLFDGVTADRTYFGTSQETSVRGAPTAYQAAAIGLLDDNTDWGYFESASFTRLRELSISWNAPAVITRAIHASALSLTLSGRNLAVWTPYRGADPEEPALGDVTQTGAYRDAGTPIPTKYWLARVSIGY